jgi:hypothetical protein
MKPLLALLLLFPLTLGGCGEEETAESKQRALEQRVEEAPFKPSEQGVAAERLRFMADQIAGGEMQQAIRAAGQSIVFSTTPLQLADDAQKPIQGLLVRMEHESICKPLCPLMVVQTDEGTPKTPLLMVPAGKVMLTRQFIQGRQTFITENLPGLPALRWAWDTDDQFYFSSPVTLPPPPAEGVTYRE